MSECVKLAAVAAVVLSLNSIDPVKAATVQFANPGWVYNTSDQINWLVNINDDTPGSFYVNLSIAEPSAVIGDMIGFGFNSLLTGLTIDHLTFLSSSTNEGITGLYTDSLFCGSGCNFNGTGEAEFDYIIRMGGSGSPLGLITQFEFLIANPNDIALTLATFTGIGIRAQSVGPAPNGGSGSVKDIHLTPAADLTPVTPVPLPAGLVLFLSGLLGIGILGRYKARRRVLATT